MPDIMAEQIFVKFPNDIKGETIQSGHEDEVPVSAVAWGVNRKIDIGSGSRQTGRATFSDVTITKGFDSASNDIAKACFNAAALDEIVITFLKDAGDASLDYLTYTLTDCLISGYGVKAGEDGKPVEAVTIAFVKLASTYKKQANDHSAGSEHAFEIDLRARS